MGKIKTPQREEFPVGAKMLPLRVLVYDDQNPRIVERLGDRRSQQEIEALLRSGEIRADELIPSFVENGYLPYEPLIVRPQGAKFIVVEGNRRLAALRAMEQSDDPEVRGAFSQHGLSQAPCLIFSGSERQLVAYLGLRHLSKTKDWTFSAKGAFVERIISSGLSLQEAARLINTSSQALRLILLTRRLFDLAGTLGVAGGVNTSEAETYFWRLGDAVRRTKTKAYLQLVENDNPLSAPSVDESRFENLVTWIFGNSKTGQAPILVSIRDTKQLDDCLGNPRAARVLERGGTLQEGVEEMQSAGETVIGHLERAKKSIERANGGAFTDIDIDGLTAIDGEVGAIEATLETTRSIIVGVRSRHHK